MLGDNAVLGLLPGDLGINDLVRTKKAIRITTLVNYNKLMKIIINIFDL